MDTVRIMIVGVGGQGTLLTSKILGSVALKKSYDVKASEVHGMAQRGGSVVTYVILGKEVFSPLIEKGEADFIIAFEELEALRWADYLKTNGRFILSKQQIPPLSVTNGKAEYPKDIVGTISQVAKVSAVDALEIARECGSVKAANVVLLGLLASNLYIEKDIWEEAILENVPPKFADVNLKAFNAGYWEV